MALSNYSSPLQLIFTQLCAKSAWAVEYTEHISGEG